MDEPEGIDWAGVHSASMALAELTWSYHQALIAAGFNEASALALTLNYQKTWLETVSR